MAPTSTYPNVEKKPVDILYCADITTNMRPIIKSMPKLPFIKELFK